MDYHKISLGKIAKQLETPDGYIRLSGPLEHDNIVNGDGLRAVIWTQSCPIHCMGCQNPETWDFKYGQEFDEHTEEFIIKSLKSDYITGLTLLGGDPFEPENAFDLIGFLKKIKALYPHKTIWCYTGYVFENLITNPLYKQMLQLIDVLVDGKFEQEFYQVGLKFKGSTNQRIIDVKKSLEQKEIILKYT